MLEEAAMEGKYLYGIIGAEVEMGLGPIGLGGAPVYTVAHRDLSCALSDYPGREFDSMPKEEVVRCLLAHQVVVEQVMREHTVLPMKFGAILATSEEVRGLLSQGYQQFADALAWIQDKVEVEVAATWDLGQILAEIAQEPEVARVREMAAALPPEEVFSHRIRLGQMVKEALDRRREDYRQRMIDFLRPWALEAQTNALLSDQMVMNVALLVERARQEEFDRRVRRLNDLFHDQIDFRIIGPLPPYSFATVEISRPHWDEVEKARRLLGLGETVSEATVRRAYRARAATVHPDLHRGDARAREGFAALQRAAATLQAYCRGRGPAETTQGVCPITREAVEMAFLITIKRASGDEIAPSQFGGLGAGTEAESRLQ